VPSHTQVPPLAVYVWPIVGLVGKSSAAMLLSG
jgi:hypothetical protein